MEEGLDHVRAPPLTTQMTQAAILDVPTYWHVPRRHVRCWVKDEDHKDHRAQTRDCELEDESATVADGARAHTQAAPLTAVLKAAEPSGAPVFIFHPLF